MADRYFFIHVMKTGGRTLLRHLRTNFELDELYPYGKLDVRHDGGQVDVFHHLRLSQLLDLAPERRARIRVYSGHFPYLASDLVGGDPVRLTLLRDPVERTISLLHQFRRVDAWADPEQLGAAPMAGRSLEEAYETADVFEPLVHDHQTKMFSITADDSVDLFTDVVTMDESRLPLAKANLARVDVVGFTERYDAFLDAVEKRTGWLIERGLRKNVTPPEDRVAVPASLRRRIEADNALDMELYEFARQLVGADAG